MKQKAIFLDRDGVLINNKDHYYIWKREQLTLVDGVIKNLQKLTAQGFQLFIVSNQGGISRGMYSKNDILKLHDEMMQIFRDHKIEISELVFCPHHSDIENCICRKPQPLMIEKLIDKHKIDKEKSYMIGDSESDIKAAEKAGIKGIKITPNENMYSFISFLIQ